MTWVRIDDQLSDHPKIVAAGPDAAWLYISSLCYAARYLTDGFIPEAQVRRLSDIKSPASAAKRLVSNGLWDAVEGGYIIHDYLEYNSPAKKVKEHRQRNADRQAKWRDKSDRDAVSNTSYNGVTNESPGSVTNDATNGPVTMPQTQTPITTPSGVAPPAETEPAEDATEPVFDQPIEYVMTLCEEMQQPFDQVSGPFKSKQCGFGKRLAEQGHSVEQVRRCIRWMRSDTWWLSKGIDLQAVSGQIDKFELAGEPRSMHPEPIHEKTTDRYPRLAYHEGT